MNGRLRIFVLIAFSVALALALGCSRHASTPTVPPAAAPPQPVLASRHIQPGVELSIALPSAALEASSSEVATVTLANSTSATVDVYPIVGIKIRTSSGQTVFDSHPERIRHPLTRVPLSAGEVRHAPFQFVVPVAGTYDIFGYLMDGTETPTIRFKSVLQQ
jgi:hypothetical protein